MIRHKVLYPPDCFVLYAGQAVGTPCPTFSSKKRNFLYHGLLCPARAPLTPSSHSALPSVPLYFLDVSKRMIFSLCFFHQPNFRTYMLVVFFLIANTSPCRFCIAQQCPTPSPSPPGLLKNGAGNFSHMQHPQNAPTQKQHCAFEKRFGEKMWFIQSHVWVPKSALCGF